MKYHSLLFLQEKPSRSKKMKNALNNLQNSFQLVKYKYVLQSSKLIALISNKTKWRHLLLSSNAKYNIKISPSLEWVFLYLALETCLSTHLKKNNNQLLKGLALKKMKLKRAHRQFISKAKLLLNQIILNLVLFSLPKICLI